MAKNSELAVIIKFNFEISLWQAIKLRIAGRNIQSISEEILKEIKEKLKS